MKINQNKLLKIVLVFLVLLLLIVQGLKSREIIKAKKLLQFEISDQQQLNSNLQSKCFKNRSNNIKNNNQPYDLKQTTAEILSELQNFKLQLIDFSSSEAELNLNLSGDFNSILNFIYYLENQIEALKVEEFKIKKNRVKLFFFIKLKNELI